MTARIETFSEKKLIGQRITMSLADDKTFVLWRKFMERRREINNNLTDDLFCLQVYDPTLEINHFNHHTTFEKWAAIEVADFNAIPQGMEKIILTGGLYAVFNHKGAAGTGSKTFQYIFQTWLPASDFTWDNRIQFEILGEKYKNDNPDSEEEVWIPIKQRAKHLNGVLSTELEAF